MTYDEISSVIMSESTEIVYVADVETYELIYLNQEACRLLGVGLEDYRHKPCYEVLQGSSFPCEFCPNEYLSSEDYFIGEQYNQLLGRHYLLKDKLIALDGKLRYRLGICIDITDKTINTQQLEQRLTVEETLLQCINTLNQGKNIHCAIQSLLQIICEFYKAERAFIFEFDYAHEEFNCTYEWCKRGIPPEIDHMKKISMNILSRWIERLELTGEFFITARRHLDPQSPEHQILDPMGVESLIAAPLIDDMIINGIIGVINPIDNVEDISLLTSVSYFVQDDLNKRTLMAKLEYMSYTDLLTGCFNRNKYFNYLDELEDMPSCPVGIAYIDINGLKKANDTHGHHYGDQLIRHASQIMRLFFENQLFRIGGDEFLVICYDTAEDVFTKKVADMTAHFESDGRCAVSIGSNWQPESLHVSEQISHADELMYIQKRAYYQSLSPDTQSYYFHD